MKGMYWAECLAHSGCSIFRICYVLMMVTLCLWCVRVCPQLRIRSLSPVTVHEAGGGGKTALGARMSAPLSSVFLQSFWNTDLNRHVCTVHACMHAGCPLNLDFWSFLGVFLWMFWSPEAAAAEIKPGQGEPVVQGLSSTPPLPLLDSRVLLSPTVCPVSPTGRIPSLRRS